MYFYEIAVNTPFNNSLLTYSSKESLKKGTLVEVPLGKRKEKGCVLKEVHDHLDNKIEIKEIISILDGYNHLSEEYLSFLSWVASYYQYPLGQHIFDVLPKPLKRPRVTDLITGEGLPLPFKLTQDQERAFESVHSSLGTFKKFLLHGVTGSGKTSVYLNLFKEVISDGKNGLFLVPEINLTPQFIKTFKKHLSGNILMYHSSMSRSEKNRVWEFVRNNEAPYLLIGVRSSIFLPFKNLGMIAIDEEHDNSYKQDDRCPYHMRDVAIKLSSSQGCPVVMGSATPTIETLYALKNTDGYLELPNRVKSLDLPEIEIVDSRSNERGPEELWPFTNRSIREIEQRINNNEQVLVFVNRLGFANFVQCGSCGKEFHCLNCHSSLKCFKRSSQLKCQICDFKMPYPESCSDCGNMKLLQKGFGTERLAEVLRNRFPHVTIGRFDRDAVKTFSELNEVLEDFKNRRTTILVGTQMLSKGHNFPGVNLVVLLGVDGQLNFPDFRSNEKVFQLVTQTSGRPGRSEKKGLVLIESLSPKNQIFDHIKNYKLKEFFEEELVIREALELPPFSKLASIYFISRFQEDCAQAALSSGKIIENLIGKHFPKVTLLGPRPGIMEKRANKFNWTILLKASDVNQLHNLIRTYKSNIKLKSSVSLKLDIDPQTLA